jgi:hypothetical protein
VTVTGCVVTTPSVRVMTAGTKFGEWMQPGIAATSEISARRIPM